MVRTSPQVDSEDMLMLVRDDETATDVEARFASQALTVADIAAAPVRHIPPAFLAAVAGLFPELLEEPSEKRGLAAL
ncbi:MAG: hypothetical protein QOJ79_3076 [Actinomycetota bacterium]|jgi:hypothetical protein|nr:hypothetical protein [Actinomycetota bacterium]